MGSTGDGPADGAPADDAPTDDAHPTGLVRLVLLTVAGGAITGLVGGLFRVCLDQAELARTTVLEWTRDAPAVRWLVPVLLAAVCVGLARLIVRFVPEAAGSGVQRVEAVVRGQLAPVRLPWLVPAKFVGGVLAIGAGLALGREGPTVQMGASVGNETARLARLDAHDRRTLIASLGGAGLGVAFSAPLAGAVFAIEELTRVVRTRLVVTVLVGTASAMAVSKYVVGWEPVFPVPTVRLGPTWHLVVYIAFGLAVGLLGVAYNRLILRCMALFDGVRRLPPEAKAAIVGGLVGALGIAWPQVVGGGEIVNEQLLVGSMPIMAVLGILAVRWFLGPASYAVGTPGGLFAPLLVVGAALGVLVADVGNLLVPAADLDPLAFGIVGMSTFFAAVVRAPVTGVVLIVEMTATTTIVIPMMLAAAAAVVAATLVRGEPIYDTLRGRIVTGH